MALAKIGAAITLDGEKEYRQALSNINRSMGELKSEMNLVRSEYEGQQNSMEALTKKSEVLNKMYAEQTERCQTLAGALQTATETYGENSEQALKWQTQLNNAQADLTRLGNEIESNNRYLDEARNSTDGCATSIDGYGRNVREASQETNTFGDVLKANLASEAIISAAKALGSAIKDIGEGVVDIVKETAAYADNILTLSNNTGIATDTLQELQYMQELTDVSLETVTKSMAKQIKSMANAQKGTADYVNAYQKLGVNIEDANGNLRDSESVYWECIDALGAITNETERDATAMQIFGKSAQDLNSIINIGSDGVAKFADEAHNMGAVLDDETLGKLGEADDALQRMDQSLQVAKRSLGVALSPSATKSIEKVTDKIVEMGDECADIAGPILDGIAEGLCWIIDNADLVASSLVGIVSGFATFKAINGIQSVITKLQALSGAAGGATGVIKGLWTAISTHPAALAAVGIGVFVAAIAKIAMESKNSKSEVDLLIEEMDKSIEEGKKLKQQAEDIFKEQDQKNDGVEAESIKYQKMTDRLYELANAEGKTNEQKVEMKYLVDELNEAFPELGLEIDNITWKLNKQRSELDKTIESYINQARVTAARDELQKIADTEAAAEQKIAEYMQSVNKLQEKRNEIEREYNEMINDSSNRDVAGNNMRFLQMNKDASNAQEEIDKLNRSIAEQQDLLETCTKRYDFATERLLKYDNELNTTSESSNIFAERTKEITENVKNEWEDINKKYKEVKETAEESILGQIELFDEFDEKAKYTKEEMLTNLDSQIEGMKNWSTNMNKATDLGVSDKILKEFRDMGLNSSGYLSEIVKMNETEIEQLNSKWETKLNISSTLSSEMANAEVGLDAYLKRMEDRLNNSSIMSDTEKLQIMQYKQNQKPGSSALSNEENARQVVQAAQKKQDIINVYVGGDKVAATVTKQQMMLNNRYNPRKVGG